MTKHVSVIIPCHNYGNIIKKAVRSVLAQTHTELELIVVNDGSTDTDTLQALEELKEQNITVLHQENKGPSAARNAGAAIAKGDYLMFLDHDDTIHPRTIELLSEALQSYPEYDYVYSSIYYFGQIPEYFVWKPQPYNAYDLIWANHPTLSSLIKREVHEKVNGFSENLKNGLEDWEYWIKLSRHAYRAKMLDLPLYFYWQHGRTHTAIANENWRSTICRIIDNNPDVYDPVYISETKKQWRPIVTIITYDEGLPLANFSSLTAQSIPDKQIIIVSSDPSRLREYATLRKEDITIIDSRLQSLAACFNQAFLSARGEFVILLQNAGFAVSTSLEEAIWRKIFDKNSAWHYYIANENRSNQLLTGLPGHIHHVHGALMESSLLRFSGGFAGDLIYHHAFQDLLLRLEAFDLTGLCISKEVLITTATQPSGPIEVFRKYPQLFGYRPNLNEQNRSPLETDQHSQLQRQPAYDKLKQLIHSDLGAPWYVGGTNQRMNIPSLINPASSAKNVLYCIPFMPGGGAEKVDLDVLAALKRDGYRITLVTDIPSDHSWKPKFAAIADEIFHVDTIADNQQQRVKFLEYLLISRNATLLFIRSSMVGYQLAASLNKEIKATIATIDLLHAYDRCCEDWIDISTPYDGYIEERIVITQNLKEYLVSHYNISRHKIRVILNGLDSSLYSGNANRGKLRNKLPLKTGDRIIGFIGRLCREKDLFKWLEVAALLNKTEPSLHFVVAGDGTLKAELQEKAAELQISNISFIGWQEKVHEVVADFDLMLMTSKTEGLPLVIMEALCSGVPVVAPDIGGIREILTNDFSSLVAADALPLVYAQKVQQLLNMEASYKEMLRTQTIQFVQQTFDIQVFQKKYIDAINKLLASKQPAKKDKAIMTYLIAEPFLAEDYRSHSAMYEYPNLADYYLSCQNWNPKVELNNSIQVYHPNTPALIKSNNDQVIADWYFDQYEVLPLWFKRLGHIVKVLYGKRSWRSLYDNDAKGYDSTVSVQQWYDNEYEVLPTWFKRSGKLIKRLQKRGNAMALRHKGY